MADDKFNNNRNKYRRVYSFGGRPPPNMQTYVDRFTGETRTRDFNQILRDRDFYLIGVMQSASVIFPSAEYVEVEYPLDAIDLAWQDTFFVTFPITFSDVPIVTLEIPTGSAAGWVNPYILSVNNTGFTLGLSAPATGTIVYKAVNLPAPNVYPAQVVRAPRFPSLAAKVSAGTSGVIGGTNVTMSFNQFDPPLVPSEFSFATVDNGNNQADTYVEESIIASNAVTADLSTYFSGTIDYIAIQ